VWLLGLSREREYSFEMLISTDETGYKVPEKAAGDKGGSAAFICVNGAIAVEAAPHAALIFGCRTAAEDQ